MEIGIFAHIGHDTSTISRLHREYLLVQTLKNNAIILPQNADGMQQLTLQKSKELRIKLGFESIDTARDDSTHMLSDREMEKL